MRYHLSIEKIELSALKAAKGENVPENISMHFSECKICYRKYSEAKEFYEKFDNNDSIVSQVNVESFGESLPSHNYIRLLPYESLPDYALLKENNITILAAESLSSTEEEISSFSFASPDEEILLKVSCNNKNGIANLFLLSEDKNKYGNSLIILFSDEGIAGHLLLDENCRSLNCRPDNLEWDRTNVVLLNCKFIVQFDNDLLSGEKIYEINKDGNFFSYNLVSRLLNFNIRGRDDLSKMLIEFDDGTNELFSLKKNIDSIKLPGERRINEILCY